MKVVTPSERPTGGEGRRCTCDGSWGPGCVARRTPLWTAKDGPHLFRHTHATALLRAGVRLEVASELLTHSSVQTTMDTYGHLDTDDLAEELDRVGFRGSW
ncbi:tyrosine-type recombinase/integrase [Streptomyces sp. NBC_01363]|uniref:tyrosine-type recombinase/integrase n=1 Tax=Streptomyces sp. NBC_01363 TaxID=2903840 RepID=UPI002255C11C|nr:tyrosine-type recombinase/integrase [Streptomyces sp. NBC_01363]MCX4734427.1 tyrosine-type recombinase/integrase [Streptomyces sp. NBC_01363]